MIGAETKKGYFQLGDIRVLIDPDFGKWEEGVCLTVNKFCNPPKK